MTSNGWLVAERSDAPVVTLLGHRYALPPATRSTELIDLLQQNQIRFLPLDRRNNPPQPAAPIAPADPLMDVVAEQANMVWLLCMELEKLVSRWKPLVICYWSLVMANDK